MPKAPKVVGAVLVVLLIAFAVPTLIASPDEHRHESVVLTEGESVYISDDTVSLYVEDLSPKDNATIKVTDQHTHNSITKVVSVNESVNYNFSEGSVEITVATVDAGNIDTHVEFVRTYNWDPTSKALVGHIGLVLTAVAVIIVVSFAAMMAVKTTWP